MISTAKEQIEIHDVKIKHKGSYVAVDYESKDPKHKEFRLKLNEETFCFKMKAVRNVILLLFILYLNVGFDSISYKLLLLY